ncbi:uncharacterized protein LOC143846006 [Tasmannia lanceolata]|uniref:uncharacterized protein LOC143846006 n=1 Tax=Tasmannia lanceolata TaxID=3420 RepID=UPI004063D27C
MKLGFWNIRGLRDDRKTQAVKDFMIQNKLDLAAVINKTWGRNQWEWFAKVVVVGTAGCIIVIWNEGRVHLEEFRMGRFSISIIFSSSDLNERWMLTAIYGPARASDRSELWCDLVSIREDWQGPWIRGGDFNTIRFPSEKSTHTRITTSMRNFSAIIQDNELIDLPLNGARFTWSNNQDRLVMSRIDRVLVTREWEECFPLISQKAFPRTVSDHNAVVLEIYTFSGGARPFRFDLDLLEITGFEDKIKQWWEDIEVGGWKGYILCQKLKGLKIKIREWQKTADEETNQGRRRSLIV